jgi:hypothetical protein
MKRLVLPRLLVATAAVAIGLAALWSLQADSPAQAQAAGAGSSVVATYGVGGVLKSNGALYQYRPEKKTWVTIDESFRLDGETRKVLPLPVAAVDVARMEGFGFIVTRTGSCWLYNLDTNRWENIGRP